MYLNDAILMNYRLIFCKNVKMQTINWYYRDVRSGILRNGEIDFVAIKGKKECFIQVAYYLEKQTTIDREYGAFKNIHDASPKYVFSLGPIDTSRNDITHINIIDFLSGKIDITIS